MSNFLVESQPSLPPLPLGWEDFIATPENLLFLWNTFNQFPILFDDELRGNFGAFLATIYDGRSVIFKTGEYGLFRMENVRVGRDAQIHLTFWDRRFRGRDKECREMLKWLFEVFNFKRLTIRVPTVAYATVNFVKSLGFQKEGVLRDAYLVNGKFLNLACFGILRDEVLPSNEGGKEVG